VRIDKFSVNAVHMRIIMEFKRHVVWISNAKFDGGSVYTFVPDDFKETSVLLSPLYFAVPFDIPTRFSSVLSHKILPALDKSPAAVCDTRSDSRRLVMT
jgi:hypothetical protein